MTRRPLLLIALGLAAGYAYGFRDAQTHDRTVVRRVAEELVARAGGSARGKYNPDVDEEADRAEGDRPAGAQSAGAPGGR